MDLSFEDDRYCGRSELVFMQWASGAGEKGSVGRVVFLFILFITGMVRTVAKFTKAILTVPPSVCLLNVSGTGIILGIVTLLSKLVVTIVDCRRVGGGRIVGVYMYVITNVTVNVRVYGAIPSRRVLLVVCNIVVLLVTKGGLLYRERHALPGTLLLIVLLLTKIVRKVFISKKTLLIICTTRMLGRGRRFHTALTPM